jgi:ATP-dependent DNA helicase RecG
MTIDNANRHKLIEHLRDNGKECEWIEFKHNKENPQVIGEAISALSNGAAFKGRKSGYLVFGIEDETLKIVGTKFNIYRDKQGNTDYYTWIVNMMSPKFDFTVHDFEHNQERVVILEIPAATNQPTKFKHIAYMRVGPNTRKLVEFPETEMALWRNLNNLSFESGIAMSHITEQRLFELLDYKAYYDLREKTLPRLRDKVISDLSNAQLIESESGWYNITNLGAILLGKNVENFQTIQRKAIRVIQYEGKNKAAKATEQIGTRGYASGFEGLLGYINERLPSNEVIGKVVRQNVPQYPPEAIRELVANALIHQDFSIPGSSVVIELYEDRIEISNPGIPLINPDKFIDEAVSRNEILAYTMRKLNICEERGMGIDVVFMKVELFQLPSPDFKQKDKSFTVTLFAPKKLSTMTKKEKIRACYQHCCLKYVVNETMTNTSLRERFGIGKNSSAQASAIIDVTEKNDLIKLVDPSSKSKKFAAYIPYWA